MADDTGVAGRIRTRRRGRPAGSGAGTGEGQVKSLSRALALLEKTAEARVGATLSDLAEQVGLAPSTTHRLLRSLEASGFLAHDPERGLWRIGVRAFTVGNGFLHARDIAAIARPIMHELMERSGESVNLAVLDEGQAVFLAQVECRELMRALARPGGRAPLHASSVGKALLAGLNDSRRNFFVQRLTFRQYTDNTIVSLEAFKREMLEIRRCGYAEDNEEYAAGLRCMAAPVFDEYGDPIGAISLSGPTARVLENRREELGDLVGSHAARITEMLGGQPPAFWGIDQDDSSRRD